MVLCTTRHPHGEINGRVIASKNKVIIIAVLRCQCAVDLSHGEGGTEDGGGDWREDLIVVEEHR